MKMGIGAILPDLAALPGASRPGGGPTPPPPPSDFFILWEDGNELEMQNGIDKVLTQTQ